MNRELRAFIRDVVRECIDEMGMRESSVYQQASGVKFYGLRWKNTEITYADWRKLLTHNINQALEGLGCEVRIGQSSIGGYRTSLWVLTSGARVSRKFTAAFHMPLHVGQASIREVRQVPPGIYKARITETVLRGNQLHLTFEIVE